MKKALITLVALAGVLVGIPLAYAATVPIATDFYADSLQSGIGKTDTSFTLVRGTDGESKSLSGPYGFTIDQGTASQENVFCTSVIGTAATGCTRGLDLTTGTTSVASLEQTHNRGASVQITTAPVINILVNILRGVETIPQAIYYDPSVTTTSLQNGNPQALASIAVASAIGSTGCSNASELLRGCVQLATGAQAASSTSVGSSGARLGIPASLATSSPGLNGSLNAVITQNDGKIAPSFLSGANENYTFNGTTSFATTSQLGVFGGIEPVGAVTAYASTTAPKGWLLTDGSSYATTSYPALFAVIGYSYGGSGANFNVPNLLGETIEMASTTANIGQHGGAATTTITQSTLPNINLTLAGSASSFTSGAQAGYQTSGAGISIPLGGSGTPLSVQNPYFVLQYIIRY